MTRIDHLKDYNKLNENRPYMKQYQLCNCGKHFTRVNRGKHYKTVFHQDFLKRKGYNIVIAKKKIVKEKIEYRTEYVSIWGTYKD